MAEEEKKYTNSTRGRVVGGTINFFKVAANKFGAKFHLSRTADLELVPRKKLRTAIELLEARLKDLNHIEEQYGYVEKEIRPVVEEYYGKLGFYTEWSILAKERILLSKGTESENNKVEENIEINGEDYKFKLPPEVKLQFPDGHNETVCYFGFSNKETWTEEYEGLILKACKDKIKKINSDRTLSDNQKKNMIFLITNIIRKSYLTVLPQLFGGLPKKEEDGGDIEMDGGKGIPNNISATEKGKEGKLYHLQQQQFMKLANLRKQLFENVPPNVRYKHTYKVIQTGTMYYTAGIDKKTKKKIIRGYELPREWCEDENEKALEVATQGYRYRAGYHSEEKEYNEGDVLLDIFDGKQPKNIIKFIEGVFSGEQLKEIKEQVIIELPLIEVVNYVHCEWDEYRDDFRDGRYHLESLTVMDYIMAANESIGGEWKTVRDPSKIGKDYRKYEMKLKTGQKILNNRVATNLNPAFDLSAFELNGGNYWQLVGKKKYYGHGDNMDLDNQKDPIISTRGLSMYIIETICREGKSLKEIHEELVSIGQKTGGFDYGPRPFGGKFCQDPFNIDVNTVNESLKRN